MELDHDCDWINNFLGKEVLNAFEIDIWCVMVAGMHPGQSTSGGSDQYEAWDQSHLIKAVYKKSRGNIHLPLDFTAKFRLCYKGRNV